MYTSEGDDVKRIKEEIHKLKEEKNIVADRERPHLFSYLHKLENKLEELENIADAKDENNPFAALKGLKDDLDKAA